METYANVSRKIWVTFQKYGIHAYPAAEEDVAYLRQPHRHLFKFKVTIDVQHDDREIEFHQFLNCCLNFYSGELVLLNKSCEMIALDLIDMLRAKYCTKVNRVIEVEVSEDGECGAIVTYQKVY